MPFFLSENERKYLFRALKLLQIRKRRFLLAVLFGTCALGSGIGLGAVSAWLIARAAQLPSVLELTVATTAVRAFGVGKPIFRYLERIFSHRVALAGMGAIRTHVYEYLSHAPIGAVAGIKRGDLLARTGSDVDDLGEVVVKSMLPAAVAATTSLLSFCIVFSISHTVGAVFALCLLGAGIFAPLSAARGAKISEAERVRARSRLNVIALTMLEHTSELKVSGKFSVLQKELAQTESQIRAERNKSARANALAAAIDVIALGITVVSAIVLGSMEVMNGQLSEVALVVCTLTPLAAFESTQRLSPAAIGLVRSANAAERIVRLLDAAKNESPRAAEQTFSLSAPPVLRAENLTVGWGGKDVAGPIDLELRAGKAIAVVGASGIGKTTLLFTLAGMLEPHAGSVTLNGIPTARIPRKDISRSLVLTAEDAHIFETSVLENLRVARGNLTAAEAGELLADAGLKKWLEQLPEGVQTLIGSDAATVSGGERRRLLLARSLAANAPFLLLDEPGEHLDPAAADALITDFLQLRGKNRGVILITHRLRPLDAADEVIFLAGSPAKIRARGTHRELSDTVSDYRRALEQEE